MKRKWKKIMLLSVAFFILCVGIGFGCSEITARKASEMLKRESVPEQTKTKYKPETKIVESEVSEETASKDDTEDMAEDKMSEDVQTETVVSEEMKRMAEDFLICIDPGHYASQNYVEDGENSYAEGDFTLELAKELAAVLKEEYGIPSVLTRDSGSITLGGYTDGALDRGHISLRGSYAAGCKLFLSLHTNANLDGANGYATCSQPIEITKPILVVNETACSTPYALDIANKVGEHLAKTGLELGIATIGEFQKAKKTEELKAWTDAENDRLSTPGTVYVRWGNNGDYYGVLRGAANVGVPGIIIEHGFHTVPEMRKQAIHGDLKTKWARADAEGIAEALGLKKEE